METHKPIHIIHCAKHNSPYSSSRGFRYDGLYEAIEYREELGPHGFQLWKLKLVHLPDQEPIGLDVPSPRLAPAPVQARKELVDDGCCRRRMTPILGICDQREDSQRVRPPSSLDSFQTPDEERMDQSAGSVDVRSKTQTSPIPGRHVRLSRKLDVIIQWRTDYVSKQTYPFQRPC